MPYMRAVKKIKADNNRDAVVRSIREASKGQPTVSVEIAGALLGLGKDAAYLAARNGKLPTLMLCSRRWRVPVAALEKLLLGD